MDCSRGMYVVLKRSINACATLFGFLSIKSDNIIYMKINKTNGTSKIDAAVL